MNEYIVHHEDLALLPLPNGEPELAPLARELYEVEETTGNMPMGKIPPELSARYEELWPAICVSLLPRLSAALPGGYRVRLIEMS
jgi:hypothetical protein